MKRIVISFLLLAVMLTGMMSVGAAAAEITIQVCASKTEVQVGDKVEYTVLATGSGVVAMQFQVRLPEGLRYVPNSGKTPENLAQKLGVPAADWTETSMMFTFYNDKGITFSAGTEILHFSCIAEKAGDWTVKLNELLPFDDNFEEFTPKLRVQKVRVIGKEEQVPPTVPTETQPAVSPETEPTVSAPTKPSVKPTVPAETQPAVSPETEPTVPAPTKPSVKPTVPTETQPMVSPEMEPSASGSKEPAATLNPETSEETTPAESNPDQTEDQLKEETLTTPPDQLQDAITVGASQDVQLKEESTSQTAVWIWIVAGVAAIAIGVIIFIILKKKRV